MSMLLKPTEICAPPNVNWLTANYIYWLIMCANKDPQADQFAEDLLRECAPAPPAKAHKGE